MHCIRVHRPLSLVETLEMIPILNLRRLQQHPRRVILFFIPGPCIPFKTNYDSYSHPSKKQKIHFFRCILSSRYMNAMVAASRGPSTFPLAMLQTRKKVIRKQGNKKSVSWGWIKNLKKPRKTFGIILRAERVRRLGTCLTCTGERNLFHPHNDRVNIGTRASNEIIITANRALYIPVWVPVS